MAELPRALSARLPAGLVGRGEEVENPPIPKDSATVMLLREGGHGVEVFLQRRVSAMAFAGGMTVFPGGGVDSRDTEDSVRWAGPQPEEWATRFGCDTSLARALVCAAVRETFEESGVLLAGTGSGEIVSDTSQYADARAALVSRELSLAGFLAEAGLTLRADLLRAWANWVTPPVEPRRHDTRFFVAALPHGQSADGATTEAESSGWQRPETTLADAAEGKCMLMPPTWIALTEISEFAGTAEILGCERLVEKVMPSFVREGDRVRVVLEAS